MIIKQTHDNIYNKRYLYDREIFWNKKLKEYKSKNTPLWNGSVYYLSEIREEIINIGLCEYKDLIFASSKGVEFLQKKYDLDFNFLYMNVQILIKDLHNRYLFGTKHYQDYIEIISVGGTIRLEDGKAIQDFKDITEYAKKEMTVETKINIVENKLKYKDMIISDNICTFLFEYQVDVMKGNTLNMGEFDGSVILDKEDIFNKEKFRTSQRLASLENFLENGQPKNN